MSLGLALFEHFKNPNNKTIICIICIQAASFDNTGLGDRLNPCQQTSMFSINPLGKKLNSQKTVSSVLYKPP